MSISAPSSQKEFFDLTFSNEPASYYLLILEWDQLELRACWYHQNKNLVTGFASYTLKSGSLEDALKSLLSEHSFLHSEFHQTIVSVRSSNYSIVPRSLNTNSQEELFRTTNELDADHETLLSYPLVNLRANVLYAVDADALKTLQEKFFHAVLIPHVAPRIEASLNRMKASGLSSLMLTHVSGEHIDVIAFDHDKLVLANSFYQQGKEDIAYYVLYSAEVLGLNPEQVTLTLSGDVSIGDESWKMLSSYWKTMELAQAAPHVKISDKLENYSKSNFDYLTQSLLCAS